MHIKAIPGDVADFAADHALVLGIAALALVGGVVYLRNNSAIAPDADPAAATQPTYGSSFNAGYGFAPLSTGGIVTDTGAGGSGGGTAVESTFNSGIQAALDQQTLSLNQQMFDFEKTKQKDNLSLSYAQLSANMSIAALNADLAYQGIQASNYQTSSQLAQSFMMSGQAISMGSITAPDGSTTNFAFNGVSADTLKKSKSTKNYLSALQASGFNDYFKAQTTGSVNNVTQSSGGSGAASPYASTTASASMQSGGSAIVAAINSDYGARDTRRTNGAYEARLAEA